MCKHVDLIAITVLLIAIALYSSARQAVLVTMHRPVHYIQPGQRPRSANTRHARNAASSAYSPHSSATGIKGKACPSLSELRFAGRTLCAKPVFTGIAVHTRVDPMNALRYE